MAHQFPTPWCQPRHWRECQAHAHTHILCAHIPPSLLPGCQRLCVNKTWDTLWYVFDQRLCAPGLTYPEPRRIDMPLEWHGCWGGFSFFQPWHHNCMFSVIWFTLLSLCSPLFNAFQVAHDKLKVNTMKNKIKPTTCHPSLDTFNVAPFNSRCSFCCFGAPLTPGGHCNGEHL